MMRSLYLFAVAPLALVACQQADTSNSSATPAGNVAAAAPAGTDWTQTVSKTDAGGYIMGNPAAPVKLLEYASFTCPHCRDISVQGAATIEELVKSGKLSWEYRSFLLNGIDISMSLLAQCQGPQGYFPLIKQIYAEQDNWMTPYRGMNQAQFAAMTNVAEKQIAASIATAGNLVPFFQARGLPADKATACLTDEAALKQLEDLRSIGTDIDKVQGTPTFILNNNNIGSMGWPELEAKLKEAVAGN
jgi:protein-disulfide isomerase